jgi:hypothetical protein
MDTFQIEGRSGNATLYVCGCSAKADAWDTIYITPCPLHEAAPKLLGEARAAMDAFRIIDHRMVGPLAIRRLVRRRFTVLGMLLVKLASYSARSGV